MVTPTHEVGNVTLVSNLISIRHGFVPDNATMGMAARLVGEARSPGLPVIDADRRIVGWIRDHELMRILYSPRLAEEPVTAYMEADMIVVEETTSLVDAVDLMLLTQSEALSVVEWGVCQGVLTRCDLLRFVSEARRRVQLSVVGE